MNNDFYNTIRTRGTWKLAALAEFPTEAPAAVLGFALHYLNTASLNNDGSISICPVLNKRASQAERSGHSIARQSICGIRWNE